MKTILIIGLLFISKVLLSQNIIDTSKLWSIYQDADAPWQQYSYYLKMTNDTFLNNYTYKKVMISYNSQHTNWAINNFIRNDSGKIYEYSLPDDILLYDFNANPGDTVYNHYDHTENLIVAQIDTVYFAGMERRRMLLHYDWEPFYPSHCETWYEGIGSLCGVLNSGEYGLTGMTHNLTCFFEDDSLIYHNSYYNSCFPYGVLNIDNIKQEEITVYPNPTSHIITIVASINKKNDYKIEIISLNNTKIYTQEMKNNKTEINLEKYSKGLYFYKLYKDNVVIKIDKILIE